MKVVTDYDGGYYITAGKEYDVKDMWKSEDDVLVVKLVNDRGHHISTRVNTPSAHLCLNGIFKEVIEEGEVMNNEFQGFEVGQQFRILDSMYAPDFEIGEVVTVKSVTKSRHGGTSVGEIGKYRVIAPNHLERCVEYLGMVPDHIFEVGQQFIVNEPEAMCVGNHQKDDVITIKSTNDDGQSASDGLYIYVNDWVNKGYLTLVEAPEVHLGDTQDRFWCDSTDRAYDTLEEALIDFIYYDWAEKCVEFSEGQEEAGSLMLDNVPDDVKREVVLKAVGITDGGGV